MANSQHVTTRHTEAIPASQETAYFFRFPLELRRQIYSELIPNLPVKSGGSCDFNLSLRKNKESCGLPMLRTKRKIYDEMSEVMYESVAFHVLVNGPNHHLKKRNIKFCKKDYYGVSDLPGYFRRIKHLSIIIVLDGTCHSHSFRCASHAASQLTRSPPDPPLYPDPSNPEQPLALVSKPSEFFSPSGPGSLQTLTVYYRFAHGVYSLPAAPSIDEGIPAEANILTDWGNGVRETLELNMHPLRRICVSGDIKILPGLHPKVLLGLDPWGLFKPAMLKVNVEYFKLLEKEMRDIRKSRQSEAV
jgi:hypothetical protein